MTKHIMILATDGFEQSELMGPKAHLEKAGIKTTVVSVESGSIKGWDGGDWGKSVTVDKTIDSVTSIDDFDALLLPGGQINPDLLRANKGAVALVRDFDAAGKPIAAICHAPWLLIEAGIIEGKTATGYHSIRTDLENAGAKVVDEEVVVDGNIITSRAPDDIPAFSKALIEAVGGKVKDGQLETA